MSTANSRPRGRDRDLDQIISDYVAEAILPLTGLSASEDVGWRKRTAAGDAPRTPEQLKAARDDSRRLLDGTGYDDGNEFAIGAARRRVNYVVGPAGFQYEVTPAPGTPEDSPLVKEVQAFVDAFAELNCLPEMEAESLTRADRDGDAFARLFPADGIPEARFVEAENVYPPAEGLADDVRERSVWGILTGTEARPRDSQAVSGYWVDEGDGSPVLVPEREIVHLKLGNDSRYPRGWPTFEPVAAALRRAEELLVAMTATGKARAKIAVVEEIPGFTREKADALLATLTTRYVPDPAGGVPTEQSVETLPYGARVRVREGTKVTFPNHSLGAADLIEAIQANLRAAGQATDMPEWMFTGLADQKYSNSFVSEAPSLKMFAAIQGKVVNAFGTGRMGRRASLVWRAVRMGVTAGLLHPDCLRAVRIKCTAPTLEVRDKGAEASQNATYIDKGVKPVALVQQELGYDPEELKKLAAKYPAPTQPPAAPPA